MFRVRMLAAGAAATLGVALVATAVAQGPDEPKYSGAAVISATGELVNGQGQRVGAVQLHEDAAGVVLIRVETAGIPAGEHGIHIHAVGKCDGPAFTTAGGHFNPGARQHGLANPQGSHGGDLPNLVAAANQTASYRTTTKAITLRRGAPNSVFDADGSALVVHADKDDNVTDPTGNSGGRIACASLGLPPAPLPPNTGAAAADDSGLPTLPLAGGLGALVVAAGLFASAAFRRR